MSEAVDKANALKHSDWAIGCEAWTFVENAELSVKLERMAAGTAEAMHYHQKAQQFFFILKGTALFEVSDIQITVASGQGLHIEAGKRHRILNTSEEDIEFLLSSQPSTANDRINCDEQN